MNQKEPRSEFVSSFSDSADPNVCCIKGCDEPVIALGLCNKHWRRNRMYGSPVALKSHSGSMKGLSAEDRFFLQFRKTDECWLWAASTDKDGYGIFRGAVGGKMYTRAHRFSYALHTGEVIPNELIVMHSCDNPRCVNPDHLSLGTTLDNMRDKISKGRSQVPQGEDSTHALLTESQVRAIMLDARPYAQIAADYGVAASTIGSVKQRVSWRSVEVDQIVHAARIGQQGAKQWSTHLTDDDVREIRGSKLTGKELAEKYGLSPQAICDIRKRRSWRHVD
jgi:hypothetical protein